MSTQDSITQDKLMLAIQRDTEGDLVSYEILGHLEMVLFVSPAVKYREKVIGPQGGDFIPLEQPVQLLECRHGTVTTLSCFKCRENTPTQELLLEMWHSEMIVIV